MEQNELLRAARLACRSARVPGARLGRAELAEAVNAHLWTVTGRRYALDAHSIARYERGVVRWPSAAYREALRAVLGAVTDAELGFQPTPRGSAVSARHTDVRLDRRRCLRTGLAGLAAAPALGSPSRAPSEYRAALDAMQATDRAGGPERTVPDALAALDGLETELATAQGTDRPAYLRVAAQTAEFAGFLHRDLGSATRCRF